MLRTSLEYVFSSPEFPQGSLYNPSNFGDFEVAKISITENVAAIRLSGDLGLLSACDQQIVRAQVFATAIQFPNVLDVQVFVNDEEL